MRKITFMITQLSDKWWRNFKNEFLFSSGSDSAVEALMRLGGLDSGSDTGNAAKAQNIIF